MKLYSLILCTGLCLLTTLFSSCGSSPPTYSYSAPSHATYPQYSSSGVYTRPDTHNAYEIPSANIANTRSTQSTRRPAKYSPPTQSYGTTDSRKLSSLYASANVNSSILSRGARSRNGRPMTPKYITIHSTQNTSHGADAWRHSAALRNGALGAKGWHYTTDESRTVQHLPTNEQGNHAENYRGGPGNVYSIGIEMCEDAGNHRGRTIDRTAKLTAYLMHKHNIPLANVKPHYHWPRRGVRVPNKNCPHFLLDNGRPGQKWQNYLNLVNGYYKRALSNNR